MRPRRAVTHIWWLHGVGAEASCPLISRWSRIFWRSAFGPSAKIPFVWFLQMIDLYCWSLFHYILLFLRQPCNTFSSNNAFFSPSFLSHFLGRNRQPCRSSGIRAKLCGRLRRYILSERPPQLRLFILLQWRARRSTRQSGRFRLFIRLQWRTKRSIRRFGRFSYRRLRPPTWVRLLSRARFAWSTSVERPQRPKKKTNYSRRLDGACQTKIFHPQWHKLSYSRGPEPRCIAGSTGKTLCARLSWLGQKVRRIGLFLRALLFGRVFPGR